MGPLACLTPLVADLVLRRTRAAIAAEGIAPGGHRAITRADLARIAPDAVPVPGGSTPNLAWGAATLGAAVEVVGAHGQDTAGALSRDSLADAGARLSLRACPVEATTTVVVLVDETGERAFAGLAGAQPTPAEARAVAADALLACDAWMIAAAPETFAAAALHPRLALSLAAPSKARLPAVAAAARRAEILLGNRAEAEALTGETGDAVLPALAALRPGRLTAVTDGAAGCILVLPDGRAVRRPARRADLVDTNGAGDAFAAGLLAGLQRGLSPEAAADLGMALAAATVSTPGPRASCEAHRAQRIP